jgi:hypothetical protein
MTEKSILEQALLQVQTLEEAVKQNAKGILASTMKQELNDLLKESLEEEEETKDEVDEQPETEENPEEEEDDMSDVEAPAGDTENDTDLDNVDQPESKDDSFGTEDADAPELPDFGSGDDAVEDENDVMDMTGASDEDVLKIFKAMKPEDGIVVKKDGDNVELALDGDEYIIKLDGEGNDTPEFESEMGEPDLDNMGGPSDFDADNAGPDMSGLDGSEDEEEEETLYEIELGDDEEEEMAEEDAKEVETTEAARTKSNPHGNKGGSNRAGLPSKKTYKAGSGVFGINEEVETLKKQNAEYKKALVLFKDKLNEVAVFNANLAYATRLFTEHSTTKQEKLNILKRFDSIATLNEAKNLFNSIKSELGSKTTVTESVATKISNAPSTSSSQEVLAESKAYENPQFKRMKDLMSKMK